jgi:hypothetical protein
LSPIRGWRRLLTTAHEGDNAKAGVLSREAETGLRQEAAPRKHSYVAANQRREWMHHAMKREIALGTQRMAA